MSEDLQSAIKKMGMSSCPTAFGMSIDFLLKKQPSVFDNITDSFGLTDDEIKAFNDYVELRRNK